MKHVEPLTLKEVYSEALRLFQAGAKDITKTEAELNALRRDCNNARAAWLSSERI